MTDSGGRRARTVGLILLFVGGAALLLQFLPARADALLWPFFVLVPGLIMAAIPFLFGRDAAPLAIPGSIVTAIGAILLYQNTTGRFDTWAYAWGLIPAAVGLGLFLFGTLADDPEPRRAGRILAVIGLALFVGFGLFFELFVFRGATAGWVGRILLPLLLIAGGAALLLWRGGRSARSRSAERERPPA